MKVLAWNIRHGGGRRIPRIAAVIASHDPDVVVMSEYRAAPGAELTTLLGAAGYPYLVAPALKPAQNGVAIASRYPLTRSADPGPTAVPRYRWIEADVETLGVRVAAFYGPLENYAYDGWWRSVRTTVRKRVSAPFVLAGDFNTGMSIVDAPRDPFYCSQHFTALQRMGMTDAWRSQNAETREYSWYSRRGGKDLNGFRLDHLLASPSLAPRIRSARYSHDERSDGTSDHSILLVDFQR